MKQTEAIIRYVFVLNYFHKHTCVYVYAYVCMYRQIEVITTVFLHFNISSWFQGINVPNVGQIGGSILDL